MKKFTKLFLALTLLIVCVGTAKALTKSGRKVLTFETADYCAAKWDATTSTLRWSGKDQVQVTDENEVEPGGEGYIPTYEDRAWGWNSAWTFMSIKGVSGDISGYTKLHLKMTDFANSKENKLTVVFKSDAQDGPTKEFIATPDANNEWELDLTTVEWGEFNKENIFDVTIYGGERTDNTAEGSVKVTDAWMSYDIELGTAVTLTQQADGSFLVGGLLESQDYTFSNWSGKWSGVSDQKEVDWTAYDYVWIKYSGFSGSLNFGVTYSEFDSHQQWGDAFKGSTASPKDPSGVIGIKLDKTNTYVKGNAETGGEYIGDIYAQHIREISLQGTGDATITLEGVYVGTEAQFNAAKAANQWVDPTVWKSIYTNNGTDVNTVLKKYFKNYLAAETKDGAIVVANLDPSITYDQYYNAGGDAKVANDHDVQFLIALPYVLKTDDKFKLSMKVKADVATGDKDSGLQAHKDFVVPGIIEQGDYKGTYLHYTLNADAVDFTTDWTTYEATITVPSSANGMSIICLNLEVLRAINTYYFKDIVVSVDEDDYDAIVANKSKQIIPLCVTEAGYATFVPVKDVIIPEGVTAYTATLVDGKVALNEVDATMLPAGQPVVIKAAKGCVNFEVTTGASALGENGLMVSDGTVVSSGSSFYVLASGEHGVGFYLLDNNVTIPAGKAYLLIETVSVGGIREFIGFADDATAIKTIETAKANGAIYNLAGQQVKKAQKGIYIIDGKKAILK